MQNIFTSEAMSCEPRLIQVDFDFSEIMDMKDDFAFISGSVVEGFGNSASDVDIYIVSKRDVGFPDGKKINYTNEEDGYYNEINWYSYQWHKAVAEKINTIKLDELWNGKVTADELSYYYRSSISIPLINSKIFELDMGEYSKQHILNMLEYFYGYQAYKDMQYAKQFLEVEEIEQSYFWINKAIGKMVDSILAANGEGYLSNKYRLSKIERAFGRESELYIKTKKLRYLGNYKKIEYINKAMEFIITLGVNKFRFEDTVVRYKIAGTLEYVDLFHYYVVHNAGNVYQLDGKCLAVLNLIRDGYKDRESMYKYCKENGVSVDKGLNKILSQLQTYGILEIE